MFPLRNAGPEVGGPVGYTYAAIVVHLNGTSCTRDDVLAALRQIRFSGWVSRTEDERVFAVAESGSGTVAAGRRGVVGVGAWLADRLPVTVLAIRVIADRQLLLAVWADGDPVGCYVSDPSREPGADDDVLAEPIGAEHAGDFAAACGRTEAAGELTELLAEQIDPDSVIESERLAHVLRLLRLPTWLVAAATLPRDIPTGPRARDLTRLGAGVPGPMGRITGRAANVVRRRRPPPPAVTDPPRGRSTGDPWLF